MSSVPEVIEIRKAFEKGRPQKTNSLVWMEWLLVRQPALPVWALSDIGGSQGNILAIRL